MAVKPESRGKLREGVDRRKRKLDDRGKHMAKVVKEKKEIADTSRKLRFPTEEGAAEIKRALKGAAVAAENEFKQQNKDLENKHGECKQAEGDLSERTNLANKNALEARKAEGQIKETRNAKSLLAQAEKTAKDDAGFTKDQRGRQKRHRERSTQNRDNLRAQLMSAKLSW